MPFHGRYLGVDPRWKGTWYCHPLQRGRYTRRPHFYEWLEEKRRYDYISFCENDTLERHDLVFDPQTQLTLEVDRLIGDFQTRTPCGTCLMLLERPSTTADEIGRWVPMWVRREGGD